MSRNESLDLIKAEAQKQADRLEGLIQEAGDPWAQKEDMTNYLAWKRVLVLIENAAN